MLPDAESKLSLRQREVLEGVASGLSRKQIAGNLGLSEHTVRAHLRIARARLESRSDAHAVASALRLGLIAFD